MSRFDKFLMDLIYDWHNDRNLYKSLHSTIPTPVHDLKFKVTHLEFSVMLIFFNVSFCQAFDGFDVFDLAPRVSISGFL